MVREIVEDSTYIIRQTNRATYERSRAAHEEVQTKLHELRKLNEDMLKSTETEVQRSEVFRSFQSNMDEQKKQLDDEVDGFVKQFELPKSYQQIAEAHREDQKKAKQAADVAKEELSHPEVKY
ncbi:hypothetical protein BBO99_00004156 [Phytophthora kernoviae]|uniref:Uncharacterized protein n=2 Tax=Phytophthora kernoviae TaxID=325452 RepID=A0A3R7GA27_9STRA|nr:hypothetical protein G195_005720 [Phytophthora kernoviae 00238/432]KAG2523564.1 hypothetical protein JM18_004481 [Phytophthora kernoviae]RLN46322.1 hypothetical protein BBI17_004850 [Phytophthora kernoviae]RLN80891.1 hypothetical protein BBO99_00004156 [Phytophthora kernoviae]